MSGMMNTDIYSKWFLTPGIPPIMMDGFRALLHENPLDFQDPRKPLVFGTLGNSTEFPVCSEIEINF
jgi:hypothetical protein